MAEFQSILFYNSGKTSKPVELTLTKEVAKKFKHKNFRTIEIIGKNEIDPIFGNGKLSLIIKDNINIGFNIKISQQVVDNLMLRSNGKPIKSPTNSIDYSMSCITLELDIGLPKPNPTSSHSTINECQKCLTHKCTEIKGKQAEHNCENNCTNCTKMINAAVCSEKNRTTEGDALMSIAYCFYSRFHDSEYAKSETEEIFKKWKSRLLKMTPTDSNPSEAWKIIDRPSSQCGYELAQAMTLLHDIEEQVTITQGKQHECNILDDCPLNEIVDNQLNKDVGKMKLSSYIREIVCDYFTDTYFHSLPSQLGLSIIARLWIESNNKQKHQPLGILTRHSEKYDSMSPLVTRPNFERRERRDSVASASSGHSLRVRRKP